MRVHHSILSSPFPVLAGVTDLGGNFYANPGFRDPANGDFHLTQGSPAIDRAFVDALPFVDADGLAPFDDPGTPDLGSGVLTFADIGPYEFQGTTTLWLDEPSAPATWTAGEQHTIAWHGGAGTVAIELQRDDNPWEVLASSLSATNGAWTWTVSGAPSERAWVRVRQEGTTDLWDVADLPVALVAAP